MSKTRLILTAKYTIYALVLLMLYVLQTTPGLFVNFNAGPILVIPAAIAIAMCEGELTGGFYGAFAGLLWDDMTGRLLFGFHGLFTAFFCIVAGLLVIHLMHCNFRNAMLFVAVAMLATGSLEFFFGYGMWGHENVWMVYVFHTLPTIAYTIIVTPLLFWMMRKIYRKCQKSLERD